MMLSLFTNLHVTGLHPVQHLDEDELAKKSMRNQLLLCHLYARQYLFHLNMYYSAKAQEAEKKLLSCWIIVCLNVLVAHLRTFL